jgi:hypothetical protein
MSSRFAKPVPVPDHPLRTRGERGREAIVSPEEITQRLELLKIEHRDLDAAIIALGTAAVPDQLQLARLKKKKLRLRDEIAWCEDQLVPDIIA